MRKRKYLQIIIVKSFNIFHLAMRHHLCAPILHTAFRLKVFHGSSERHSVVEAMVTLTIGRSSDGNVPQVIRVISQPTGCGLTTTIRSSHSTTRCEVIPGFFPLTCSASIVIL